MAKFDPLSETPEWTDWKKFGEIDYVIDINNLSKFGFGKNFGDWGTYTQHMRVCAFFITFYVLWQGYSLNGWNDFHVQYLKLCHLVRGGAFSILEKINSWPWPVKGQIPPFCAAFEILTVIFSKTVQHYITLSAFQKPPTPKVTSGASTITCYTKYSPLAQHTG